MPRKKRKYEEYLTLGTGPDGKRIRKYISADTKAEFDQKKYQAKKEYELVRNPSVITFKTYADKWKEIYKANTALKTKEMYNRSITKCEKIHQLPLRSVSASDLQGIINANAEYPRTCEQIKLTLKQIYKAAIKDGIVPPFNLAEDLKLPAHEKKEMRFIRDEEMKKIDEITDWKHKDGLYLRILRHTGMRPSEVLALQWTDIDHQKLQITVQRAFEYESNIAKVKDTKTHKRRSVPLPKALSDELKAEKKEGIFIFTRNGGPYTESAFDCMGRRILRRINLALGGNKNMKVLNGISLYSFRHTYATWIYYNAVVPGIISTKKAAAIMGHSEKIFIDRYTHINESHEKMDELQALLDGKKGDQRETKPA